MVYDLIVVGAGPAGLTAALYARRANKTVLLLEKDNFGGQITFSPKVENYPGFAQISGSELADHMVEQVLGQGVEVELCCVTGIKEENGRKVVTTEEGSYEATAVILATGARHRMLGLPQEERFVGQGISFCAVCDGAFYQGKHVGMVGGGNSALQEALLLSDLAAHVTVIQNLHDFTGEERLARQLQRTGKCDNFHGYGGIGAAWRGAITACDVALSDRQSGNGAGTGWAFCCHWIVAAERSVSTCYRVG